MKKTKLILASATLFGIFALSTIAFANGGDKDKTAKKAPTCQYTKGKCTKMAGCDKSKKCENKGKCSNKEMCKKKK